MFAAQHEDAQPRAGTGRGRMVEGGPGAQLAGPDPTGRVGREGLSPEGRGAPEAAAIRGGEDWGGPYFVRTNRANLPTNGGAGET